MALVSPEVVSCALRAGRALNVVGHRTVVGTGNVQAGVDRGGTGLERVAAGAGVGEERIGDDVAGGIAEEMLGGLGVVVEVGFEGEVGVVVGVVVIYPTNTQRVTRRSVKESEI